ncbi:MAG: thioredoxin domain-containing protein [Nitrospinaceae bacterium]|nr:thioredoxin domain-containing protein [Nitrospinaceae bacterium]NIR55187.1 thioredoxin domain-containing protein [Nitrospinaceae bacterium]NIS85611.1 thioredoxin domain-containing protein [Nitrospinaceae bacterium]NIT82457.1 thioredoxin domain-containing protein [Nitrospinaceae bacterium]NIU44727.1 thioredoxin domain-containing protein [Nitrospinaceae bacterium]
MSSLLKTSGLYLLVSLLFYGSLTGSVRAEEKESSELFSNNPVVALADGQPILLDDLKNARIHEMMVRLYTMQRTLLKQKVVNSLSETHPELKSNGVKKVKQEDIERFYRTEPGIKDMGELTQIEGQIRVYLEKIRRRDYLKDLEKRYQMAVEKGWVVDYFDPPNDFLLQARLGTAMLLFNEKSGTPRKVFVMEYSDFLCPFCRKVQGTLQILRKKYAANVQFGYRHFPIHPEARILSEAVECARDQGRFWQFQRVVYKNPRGMQRSKSELIKGGRLAGIRNISAFEKCIDSGKYRDRVQKDFEEGVRLGIQGTPTFIIGSYNPVTATVDGEMFSGAVSSEKFVGLIEKYLKRSQE